jgi:hypothetical protein
MGFGVAGDARSLFCRCVTPFGLMEKSSNCVDSRPNISMIWPLLAGARQKRKFFQYDKR